MGKLKGISRANKLIELEYMLAVSRYISRNRENKGLKSIMMITGVEGVKKPFTRQKQLLCDQLIKSIEFLAGGTLWSMVKLVQVCVLGTAKSEPTFLGFSILRVLDFEIQYCQFLAIKIPLETIWCNTSCKLSMVNVTASSQQLIYFSYINLLIAFLFIFNYEF